MSRWLSWILVVCVAFLACGGKKEAESVVTAAKTVESDPLALFPAGAIAIARVDAKALFSAGGSGAEAAKLAERFFPVGQEAGFSAVRDLETVYAATYSMQGADALGVGTGNFDEAKIRKVADDKVKLKSGVTLVATPYAGRTIYTAANVGFSVISPKIVIVGTETAMRRALDRLRDGIPARALSGSLVETLETKDAAFAGGADLKSNPIADASIASQPIPGLKGLQVARIIGDFKAPGFHVAGTFTYDDASHAGEGEAALKQGARLLSGLAKLGAPVPQLQDFQVTIDRTNLQTKFAVDDRQLKDLLSALPTLLGL